MTATMNQATASGQRDLSRPATNEQQHTAKTDTNSPPKTQSYSPTVGAAVENATSNTREITSAADVPPSVVKAICRVQLGLDHVIVKKGKNPHGGYKFLSVDDLFAVLCKRMAEAGLVCLTLEKNTKEERVTVNSKTVLFCTFTYGFILATTEGDTWTDPKFVRTVRTRVDGPQAYAAAKSFALKSFLRGLFLVPSGDTAEELDSVKQAPTIEEQSGIEESPAPKKRKSSAAAKRDGQDAEYSRLMAEIQRCRDPQELEKIRLAEVKEDRPWGAYPKEWAHLLEDNFDMRLNDLKNAGA